jgi:hypothetical protein
MREIRSYGSVRGVAGDRYPYRDRFLQILGSARRYLIGPAAFRRLQNRAGRQFRLRPRGRGAHSVAWTGRGGRGRIRAAGSPRSA